MPHLVIEYSSGLDKEVELTALMDCAYEAAVASGTMQPEDVKVRLIAFSHYRLDKTEGDFVHITCRLLAGRTVEQKVRLSTGIREGMVDLLPDVYSISVDVVDMDPDAYKKRVLD